MSLEPENSAEKEYRYAENKGRLLPFFNEWFRPALNPHGFILKEESEILIDTQLCRFPDGKQLLVSLSRDEELYVFSENEIAHSTPREWLPMVWEDLRSGIPERGPLEITVLLGNLFIREIKQFVFSIRHRDVEYVSHEVDDDDSAVALMAPTVAWPLSWREKQTQTTIEGFLIPNRPGFLEALRLKLDKTPQENLPIKEG